MARPKRDQDQTNFVETPEEKTYVKYNKLTIEVEVVMSRRPNEGKRFSHYTARVVEIMNKKGIASRNIAVDPIHAELMNRQWHNTKYIMWQVDKPMPTSIKRTATGETEVNGGWHDEYTF